MSSPILILRFEQTQRGSRNVVLYAVLYGILYALLR